MFELDLERIKKEALAATPGEWTYDWGNWAVERKNWTPNKDMKRLQICSPDMRNCSDSKQRLEQTESAMNYDECNGIHIANMSPKNTLILIAEIERQRALIERAKPLFKEAGSSLRYPRGAHAIEYWENQYSNWLKDAND
jgi:hypothetical protein